MEKIALGRYAQLTQDLAFKRVFASEEDKDLLVAMLNTFLECKLAHPIKHVDIKNPYIPGQTPTDRDAVLDIHCQDAEGNRFITEMQILPQKHFIQRALFYSGTSIASSGKKGIAW
ncbi:MAG: Rpn family recombination-promoting nuclease/putative transposase, partial [Fibromonadaceae bacterium]|nr:Rpn family recombination-promoting nuclease/putative transposase [Fibromonadaceae bacterium]